MSQQATAEDLNFFEQRAKNWALDVVDLYNTPVVGAELIEKKQLLDRAKKIKDSIEFITGDLDVFKPINAMQLDALPVLIGAGAIAAASAYIYAWNTRYKMFKRNLAERVRLEKSGLTPTQAANLTNSLNDKKSGLFSFDMKKILIPAALTIGGFYLLKQVRKN